MKSRAQSKTAREVVRRVLEIERAALGALLERLEGSNGDRLEKAVELMLACRGRVVVAGMGKSGLIARKISATLASTGTPALFLHPAEAAHGDLG
ncbi:MAG: SIS domain-containing protein, partial [Terriglobia bacterium]